MPTLQIFSILCFGFALGIAVSLADMIERDREIEALNQQNEELAADLNAYRVMAEWDKFEQERP